MNLAAMVQRANDLPRHVPLRTELLHDLYVLLESERFATETPGVPACISALIGLTTNHLEARLACLEERATERGAPR
jgi:hypothetical protein